MAPPFVIKLHARELKIVFAALLLLATRCGLILPQLLVALLLLRGGRSHLLGCSCCLSTTLGLLLLCPPLPAQWAERSRAV